MEITENSAYCRRNLTERQAVGIVDDGVLVLLKFFIRRIYENGIIVSVVNRVFFISSTCAQAAQSTTTIKIKKYYMPEAANFTIETDKGIFDIVIDPTSQKGQLIEKDLKRAILTKEAVDITYHNEKWGKAIDTLKFNPQGAASRPAQDASSNAFKILKIEPASETTELITTDRGELYINCLSKDYKNNIKILKSSLGKTVNIDVDKDRYVVGVSGGAVSSSPSQNYTENAQVILVGMLGTAQADPKETIDSKPHQFPAIKLDKAINFVCQKGSQDCNPSSNVSIVQLAMDEQTYQKFNALKGKSVKIDGTLFSAHTARHYAPVLIEVKSISN